MSHRKRTNRTIRRNRRARPLTRRESKLVTRDRLLTAGLELLAEGGYEELTTGSVARRAGVAQPTVYVHFRSRDELLAAVAEEVITKTRRALRDVRLQIARGGDLLGLTRQTFRLPLATITQRPHRALLRLFASEMYRLSVFGRAARSLVAELTQDLVQDLEAMGFFSRTPRKRLELVSETVIVMTIHFGVAYVDRRYRDLDELADLLAQTTVHLLMDATRT